MKDKEIWKPVLGWEGFYEASSLGQIRSCPRPPRKRQYRILKPGTSHDGYLMVSLNRHCNTPKHVSKNARVHKLVLEAFTGKSYKGHGMYATHINGEKLDNRAENLRWASPSQNQIDRRDHGRMPMGETHHTAKLNPDKVRAIRLAIFRDGESITRIARRFKVSCPTIVAIRDGKTWRHIPSSFTPEDKKE